MATVVAAGTVVTSTAAAGRPAGNTTRPPTPHHVWLLEAGPNGARRDSPATVLRSPQHDVAGGQTSASAAADVQAEAAEATAAAAAAVTAQLVADEASAAAAATAAAEVEDMAAATWDAKAQERQRATVVARQGAVTLQVEEELESAEALSRVGTARPAARVRGGRAERSPTARDARLAERLASHRTASRSFPSRTPVTKLILEHAVAVAPGLQPLTPDL